MRKKILLIEDEPLLVDLYTEAFEESDLQLIVATNGKDGLKSVHQAKPDLILLDILLPGINGFEVLKKLKIDESTRDIPVIVLTNLGSEQSDNDKHLALSLGAVDYLVKSYHNPDEIVEIVKARFR